MDICSFKSLAGGMCGFDREDRTRPTKAVPILLCKKDISSHARSCKFSFPQTELDLKLCRIGKFKVPHDIDELTICLQHRSVLGIGWSRSSNRRRRIPTELSGHREKLLKGDRGVNKHISQMIKKNTGKEIIN